MQESLKGLKRNAAMFRSSRKVYRQLQKHLNSQAVGFPATLTGVELRMLKDLFSTEEAKAALFMSFRHEPFETIFARAEESGYTEAEFKDLLDRMEKKGSIFVKDMDTRPLYALHPLVIGMYELQVGRLTPEFHLNIRSYMVQQFAMEYLTSEIPQMRVIPVQKSLRPELNVATYDEIREMVMRSAGRIMIAECICKKAKDFFGTPCQVTERREVCMGFRDFHDTYTRNGWGRSISTEEALEILDQNEKDGLVLMPSNSQEPQFVCSCCSCCCGIMEIVSMVPRPVDHTASNFQASLDAEACNGCGRCGKRCQMNAIRLEGEGKKAKAVAIDERKCIGCGLCVTTCKTGALDLVRKEKDFVPPRDHDALYETLMEHKPGTLTKAVRMGKAVIGMQR